MRIGEVLVSRPSFIFPRAPGFAEAEGIRRFECHDIVARSGVISADRILLQNYPIAHPISAFNASVIYDEEDEELKLYARIVHGYYMYVSSIAEVRVPIGDVFNRYVNANRYAGRIVIHPSNKYDIWGTEDPRAYRISGKPYMTYAGRSINYFNPYIRVNRTLPIMAAYDRETRSWVKRCVLTLSPDVFGDPISNKDSFLHMAGNKTLFFFHRPHLSDESFRLMISRLNAEEVLAEGGELREVRVDNCVEVLGNAPFEGRIGWATPPIDLDRDRVIALIHSVDKDMVVYRVFAAQLLLKRDEILVEAVTPSYIMEPKTPYEMIGDRPLVVFPCGMVKVKEKEVLITYGAADYMIGIGLICLDDLLAELDRGRIY